MGANKHVRAGDISVPTADFSSSTYLRPLVGSLWDTEVIPGVEKLDEAGKKSIDRIGLFERPMDSRFAWSLGVKSEADTNLTQAGELPRPNSFWIMGFSFKILDRAVAPGADVHNIRQGLFTFIFSGQRMYFQRPIDEMPEGMDESKDWKDYCKRQDGKAPSLKEAMAAAAAYFSDLEKPPARALNDGGFALTLMPGEQFHIQLKWPGGLRLLKPARVRATIWGVNLQCV